MDIIEVNETNFDQEITNYQGQCLVDFWATWCGPCRMLAPILEEIAKETNIKICKVNVDENPTISRNFAISSIPAVFAFKDGKKVGCAVGLRPKQDYIDVLNEEKFLL
ncbi:MAG: thioredoxin [Coriobacteriales bacterium]|nr:thioredoxin [Coriobacteriales bacterium]